MGKKIDLFLSIGTEIKDPEDGTIYKLKKLLGSGAFAQCYLAETENEEVALKIVKLADIKTKRVKEKLESEILIHLRLDHPCIVKMNKSFRDKEYAYMVLEYCENGSLDILLKNKKKFEEEEVRKIVKQIVIGLKYLHTQVDVVHRDLKLGNLFLKNGKIKIGDFGLAAIICDGQKKTTVCGTPNYIAPEVLFDKTNGHSFEADIWSLGVIIYTLIIGDPPFQSKDVKVIYKKIEKNVYIYPDNCNISLSAKKLIDNILSKDPMERPSLDQIYNSDFLNNKTTQIEKVHLFRRIIDNLKNNPKFSKPNLDYLIFSIPLSSLKGIGYILKSGYFGIYFNDHTNLLYKQKSNTFTYINVLIQNNRKVLKKEEHLSTKVPVILKDKFEKLIFFIKNFSYQQFSTENVNGNSFVVRLRRIENGLLHVLWNETVCLDFNDRKIVVHDEGRKLYSFDKELEIKVTYKDVEDVIVILEKLMKDNA